jgi:hypothetical protein
MAAKSFIFLEFNGAPGEIRTPDLLIRSQSLYPAELRAHMSGLHGEASWNGPFPDYQDCRCGATLLRQAVGAGTAI